MRTIILPHSVTDILRRRKADAISQWIFPDPVKPEDPVDPNAAYRHMKTLLQRAGLPRIRFHDLRHSCASLMVMNGVSMKQVQEWLGHSTFSTTADIYAHLDYKSKEGSAGVIAGLLETKKLKDRRIPQQSQQTVVFPTDSTGDLLKFLLERI